MKHSTQLAIHRAILVGVVAYAYALLVAGSSAQAITPQRYLPTIYHIKASVFQPKSIQVITDITMPFDVYGAVEPIAVQDGDGLWYITVYRLGGANTGQWIVTWLEGQSTVTPIGLFAPATDLAVGLQDVPISNSRGSVSYTHDMHNAYIFTWQDQDGGSRRPKLRVAKIIGFTP